MYWSMVRDGVKVIFLLVNLVMVWKIVDKLMLVVGMIENYIYDYFDVVFVS